MFLYNKQSLLDAILMGISESLKSTDLTVSCYGNVSLTDTK